MFSNLYSHIIMCAVTCECCHHSTKYKQPGLQFQEFCQNRFCCNFLSMLRWIHEHLSRNIGELLTRYTLQGWYLFPFLFTRVSYFMVYGINRPVRKYTLSQNSETRWSMNLWCVNLCKTYMLVLYNWCVSQHFFSTACELIK
jgi:hypothetical protein